MSRSPSKYASALTCRRAIETLKKTYCSGVVYTVRVLTSKPSYIYWEVMADNGRGLAASEESFDGINEAIEDFKLFQEIVKKAEIELKE